MEKFRHYLQGIIGMFAVLGVVGLFTQHPAQSVTGAPVPVQVSNTVPIATSDVALGAKQPFQETINVPFNAGDLEVTVDTPAVPAGKRLVIETTSYFRSPALVGQTVNIFVNTQVNNKTAYYALPSVSANAAAFPGVTQAIKCYADPGTIIEFTGYRSSSTGAETEIISLSGYLVNVP